MSFSLEKEENQLPIALHAYNSRKFKSFDAAATYFGVSKWKLRNRKDGKPPKNGRISSNKVLNDAQEESLICWIELLNSVYLSPTAFDIKYAANRILMYCGSDWKVSKMYRYNFIRYLLSYLILEPQKPIIKAQIETKSYNELIF